MVTPVAKREAVGHLRSAFEVSERRACTVIEADRTSVRYRVRRADDEPIRVRLRELASQRRRFGYRRLHVLLTREGPPSLPRGTATGAAALLPQAGCRYTGPDSSPPGRQSALEPRLRIRCIERRPPLSDSDDRRRLHPRVPGAHR